MFERFTDRARKIMALANQECQRYNHEIIGVDHSFIALLKEGSGIGASALKNRGYNLKELHAAVAAEMTPGGVEFVSVGKMPQRPSTKAMVCLAIETARNFNHNYVGSEHLLIALLLLAEDKWGGDEKPAENDDIDRLKRVFQKLGLQSAAVREAIVQVLDAKNPDAPKPVPYVLDNLPDGGICLRQTDTVLKISADLMKVLKRSVDEQGQLNDVHLARELIVYINGKPCGTRIELPFDVKRKDDPQGQNDKR